MAGPRSTSDTPERDFTPALGYHWMTPLFDLTVRLFTPELGMRGLLADTLIPAAGEAVLEFGCGTASNLALLARRFPAARLTGVDIDPTALAIAGRKLERQGLAATLDGYGGGQLPYDDGAFDAVFSFLVFHHLTADQKREALSELSRVLKPGGRLVLADWGAQHNPLLWLGFFTVRVFDGFETTRDNAQGLLPNMIRDAGFEGTFEKAHKATPFGRITYWFARKPRRSYR